MYPKVSVIVPVYNAEKWLRRTLESIEAQTMGDFEVIVVDDGSTDSSGSICDGFVAKDSRFRVIHKENAGVSCARQDGLDEANGEYVIHVDSDDWVENKMLSQLYTKAKSSNADVVICDFFDDINGQCTVRQQRPSSLEPKQVLRDLFTHLHGSCWNKLIRRSCFQKYSVTFTKGLNYCEDLLTWVQLFSHDDIRIAYLNKAFYHYCDNPNSITREYGHSQYKSVCMFAKLLEQTLPADLKDHIMPKVSLQIFTGAFIHGVLAEEEIQDGIIRNWTLASHYSSLRWKLGYYMIKVGAYKIARLLIHY